MIIFVGKSGSGKTTTASLLTNHGYKRTITDTTRKPRPGEVDGKDYNFLTEEDFVRNINNGIYAENITYSTKNGNTMYGSRLESYKDLNGIIVLDPRGVRSVVAKGISALKIYLRAEDETLLHRLEARGDNLEDVYKRLAVDEPEFESIEDICDYIIDVDNLSPSEVVDKVLACVKAEKDIYQHNEDKKKEERKKKKCSKNKETHD